jgi:hypothetical protein
MHVVKKKQACEDRHFSISISTNTAAMKAEASFPGR